MKKIIIFPDILCVCVRVWALLSIYIYSLQSLTVKNTQAHHIIEIIMLIVLDDEVLKKLIVNTFVNVISVRL